MSRAIPIDKLTRFAIDVLVAAGADREQAAGVVDVLVWADRFGRPNQGVWRLPILCKRLSAGLFSSPCKLRIEERAPAVVWIDGDNGMGHYVGRAATDVAIERAQTAGTGVVAVSNSNFLGALGYYVQRMAEQKMLGILLSNSFPKVAPHGGTRSVIGTNPLAFAAPLGDGTSVIVDLATSSTAGSAITKAAELGQPLPEGIAIDPEGRPITDASQVGKGSLLPMAGPKGYALGLMVEILAGVATGAGISHGVKSMYKDFENAGNSGHFLVAISVESLMPIDRFHERMDMLVTELRGCEGVLLPGEARWKANAATDAAGGVELDPTTTEALTALAAAHGVATPW